MEKSVLQLIKDWVISACALDSPPDWLPTFVDAFSVAILVACVVMVIWLVAVCLKAVVTFFRR